MERPNAIAAPGERNLCFTIDGDTLLFYTLAVFDEHTHSVLQASAETRGRVVGKAEAFVALVARGLEDGVSSDDAGVGKEWTQVAPGLIDSQFIVHVAYKKSALLPRIGLGWRGRGRRPNGSYDDPDVEDVKGGGFKFRVVLRAAEHPLDSPNVVDAADFAVNSELVATKRAGGKRKRGSKAGAASERAAKKKKAAQGAAGKRGVDAAAGGGYALADGERADAELVLAAMHASGAAALDVAALEGVLGFKVSDEMRQSLGSSGVLFSANGKKAKLRLRASHLPLLATAIRHHPDAYVWMHATMGSGQYATDAEWTIRALLAYILDPRPHSLPSVTTDVTNTRKADVTKGTVKQSRYFASSGTGARFVIKLASFPSPDSVANALLAHPDLVKPLRARFNPGSSFLVSDRRLALAPAFRPHPPPAFPSSVDDAVNAAAQARRADPNAAAGSASASASASDANSTDSSGPRRPRTRRSASKPSSLPTTKRTSNDSKSASKAADDNDSDNDSKSSSSSSDSFVPRRPRTRGSAAKPTEPPQRSASDNNSKSSSSSSDSLVPRRPRTRRSAAKSSEPPSRNASDASDDDNDSESSSDSFVARRPRTRRSASKPSSPPNRNADDDASDDDASNDDASDDDASEDSSTSDSFVARRPRTRRAAAQSKSPPPARSDASGDNDSDGDNDNEESSTDSFVARRPRTRRRSASSH